MTPARLPLASAFPGLDALSSVFLRPLGLAAVVAAVPVVLLYLLKPDPERVAFPAVEFLVGDGEERRRHPALRRLRRNVLLAVQLLAILAIAVSLAAPYVPVSESETVSETVLVVDASASMATESGGTARFDRAISAATDAATAETSVVVAGAETAVVARRAPPADAEATLSGLSVADAPGDLRGAIDRAAAVAGDEARILVLSDFASGDWRSAVSAARAEGYDVSLRQFARGGSSNVGLVDYAFADGTASVRVKNTGDSTATRTVSLGDESESLTLAPGEVKAAELPVPAGGGTLRLSPGDAFPTDDRLSVAAPAEPTMDVLVVTNDQNDPLVTALRVIRGTSVTVKNPPASVSQSYDLVVFGGVEPGRLLNGTVQVARETLAGGGGVVIQAQSNLSAVGYGDLLPVAPNGTVSEPAIRQPNATGLTADVTFPAPERAVRAELRSGRALLETVNGTPLLATARRGPGEVLYYGYPAESSFSRNYRYPVFWKRVVYDLTGRRSLAAMNPETGTSLPLGGNTTAETPAGPRTTSVLTFREAGFYEVGGDRYGASLASATESNVSAPRVGGEGSGATGGGTDTETTTVPRRLTPVVAAVALALVLLELAVLRYRGDLR